MVKLTLKQLRTEKGLTQAKCAELLQVSLRTYKRYESDESKISSLKHQYLIQRLNEYGIIDEDHGLLTIEQIKNICNSIFKDYSIEYCYLFGSYAKGKATEKSDVDLLVTMPVDGMKFFELAETLREKLKKKVDLLDIAQLNNNSTLVQEILKDGIKIYG
ncbi:MAG: nucleotidyltransferase domain-containing protein [Candidatus Enterosoma sp.]|nr:nucleotidyltransferase domain-containing protein [Candidatus Enterosoma sp.]